MRLRSTTSATQTRTGIDIGRRAPCRQQVHGKTNVKAIDNRLLRIFAVHAESKSNRFFYKQTR